MLITIDIDSMEKTSHHSLLILPVTLFPFISWLILFNRDHCSIQATFHIKLAKIKCIHRLRKC